MEPVEAAILCTILYADVFDFAMTPAEIHHFLIADRQVAFETVVRALAESPCLAQRLSQADGLVALAERASLIPLRQSREQASARLMPHGRRYGVWLARLPFARMVALTGALAMHNAASADDDIDYLLVTAPGRVWLGRAFSILLVRLARRRGVVVCPNYVVAETALRQDRQDVFIAHEVAQMTPLVGRALYDRFCAANGWTTNFLPNAIAPFHASEELPIGRIWASLKRAAEALLGGRIGNALETWEKNRKLRRFARDMQTPHSAARLDGDMVKGHFKDHGYRVLEEYAKRLREHGLAEEIVATAGD